jgi:GT2 family glycosyltransferase
VSTQVGGHVADDRAVSVLAVVPTYLRTELEAELLLRCLVSLSATAPEAEVVVVDDASPASHLVAQLAPVCAELGFRLICKDENTGFSRTVNAGLRLALEEGKDALLVNQDIQFVDGGWLQPMLDRTDSEGRPAAVVGAKLLYPSGEIQHAGVLYSRLYRWFDHRLRFAPGDLPEANVPQRCPVTGALQLIRHATLTTVGLYDEAFQMGHEDVDYCLRTFDAGLECIYEPAAWALHHESAIRGRLDKRLAEWQMSSSITLLTKYLGRDHTEFSLSLT